MVVEAVDSNSPVIVENGKEAYMPTENGKVNIKFGSHGTEEPVIEEVTKVSEANLPKDVADEWPEPNQIHSFYFIKYRASEDQNLKTKLELAEKELQKKNLARSQFIDKLKTKRGERAEIIAQIRALSVENKQFRTFMDEKKKEMEPLQQALGKLRGASGGRERASGICSSEEELNDLIKSLQYRIQHESIPLSEEKQILWEIKLLEGTREKVIANAAERARIQDALGEKEAIQDQVKLIGVDLDGVRKEKQAVNSKLKQLDDEKLAVEKVIKALEEELTMLTEKRDMIFENIKEMRKQREDGNSPFHQNRSLLSKAKSLAANKDVVALKELSDTEVENFMFHWNSNKAFRNDYEMRVFPSLDMRQLGRDGRMRNPDEKPMVLVEAPTPSEKDVIEASVKQIPKEDFASSAKEFTSEQKLLKANNARSGKQEIKKTEIAPEKIEKQDEEEVFQTGKSQKDSLFEKDEVDEMKLKELKRAEEKAKRLQTEERKKKLAEKSAAKAAIRVQKEADKKLKEREKRARKKNGATVAAVDSEEPTEVIAEVAEPETVQEKVETSVVRKNKDRKDNIIRHRTRSRGGVDSLPKAILKRKKSTNYLIWAIPAASVVLALLVVGYIYLS